MAKKQSNKLRDNCQFYFIVGVLILACFVVWQIYFLRDDRSPATQQVESTLPEGFTLVEKDDFSFAYPNDWPTPNYSIQPLPSAILKTVDHPPLFYNEDFKLWQVAEDSGDYSAGDVYLGLGIARLERNITIYDAGFADEDCGFSLYVFIANGKLVQIRLPTFCSPQREDPLPEDTYEYTQEIADQEEDVLFSISLNQ